MTDENNEVICSAKDCHKPIKEGQVVVASNRFTVTSLRWFGPLKIPMMNVQDARAVDYWHEECLG